MEPYQIFLLVVFVCIEVGIKFAYAYDEGLWFNIGDKTYYVSGFVPESKIELFLTIIYYIPFVIEIRYLILILYKFLRWVLTIALPWLLRSPLNFYRWYRDLPDM